MYFAQLDENNVVIQVIVAEQDYINTLPGTWVETDYNGVSPKNYAGIGYTYRADLNAFIPPKGFASWELDLDTCRWKAPIPMPNDGKAYAWDEEHGDWLALN